MGQARGHQAVHGPGVLEQRHLDADGVPDHEQPPEAAEIRPQQKYPCHRRFRLRQDALFRETKPDADAQQLRCDRSERLYYKQIDKGCVSQARPMFTCLIT